MTVVCLGIGAAKAGTSWLHAQLAAHPDCHFRTIKELHYFDALDGGRLQRELEKHSAEQAAVAARVASAGNRPSEAQAARLRDRADWIGVLEHGAEAPDAYLGYLNAGAGAARVVGDMTPAYALLSAKRLGAMSRLAADVRMIFLMRDPVERLWSHVRMIAARRDPSGKLTGRRCDRILSRVIDGDEDQIARRSDYAGTLSRLVAAVPPAKVLVQVFEELVSGRGFDRVCDFLGIARRAPDPMPIHAGLPLDMTAEQREKAARWLAPQYEAAERALGRLPEAWGRKG